MWCVCGVEAGDGGGGGRGASWDRGSGQCRRTTCAWPIRAHVSAISGAVAFPVSATRNGCITLPRAIVRPITDVAAFGAFIAIASASALQSCPTKAHAHPESGRSMLGCREGKKNAHCGNLC